MRKKTGISLVETMIALIILAVALFAMAAVPIMTTKTIAANNRKDLALAEASAYLDLLDAQVQARPTPAAPGAPTVFHADQDVVLTFPATQPYNAANPLHKYLTRFQLRVTDPGGNRTASYDCTITWRGLAGPASTRMERRINYLAQGNY